MEDLSRYLVIKRKLLIYCMLWIFSAAEGKNISKTVGSTVMLACNESLSVNQLTWKMNERLLLSYKPEENLHTTEEAKILNISMSESQQYKLIIKKAEMNHTGIYKCEAITHNGVWEETWNLIIIENNKAENWTNLLIPVAAIVPCVCCLIFIFALAIMRRACKCHSENQHPTGETGNQPEDIYENCLEISVSQCSSYRQPSHCNDKAQ